MQKTQKPRLQNLGSPRNKKHVCALWQKHTCTLIHSSLLLGQVYTDVAEKAARKKCNKPLRSKVSAQCLQHSFDDQNRKWVHSLCEQEDRIQRVCNVNTKGQRYTPAITAICDNKDS